MTDWDAARYLRFADERTRAAEDLLARVPLEAPACVFDLGCGPGNSTELLAARFPDAGITGLDSSEAMLAAARTSLPKLNFAKADLATWTPPAAPNLLFANAVFQWVPDHPAVLQRLAAALAPGGALAVQMPDNLDEPVHRLMREVAVDGPWAARLADAVRPRLQTPSAYYDLLKPECRALDIWHTIYNHVLAGPAAVVDWVKATGLRPFLAPLTPAETEDFLAIYTARIEAAYPPQADGTVLLRFPRLFIVALR